MKRLTVYALIFALICVPIYFIMWSFSYKYIMGSDDRFYYEYMRLAWKGGGEFPTFINLYAVCSTIITVVLIFLFYFYVRMFIRRKKKGHLGSGH